MPYILDNEAHVQMCIPSTDPILENFRPLSFPLTVLGTFFMKNQKERRLTFF